MRRCVRRWLAPRQQSDEGRCSEGTQQPSLTPEARSWAGCFLLFERKVHSLHHLRCPLHGVRTHNEPSLPLYPTTTFLPKRAT